MADDSSGLVQLQDPSGNLTSVTPEDAATLQQVGYKPPTPEQLQQQAQEEKFGSAGQQILTGLEGAGEGATFGLSTGVEKAFGVDPADIRARRAENPGSHMLGQVAGLAGSSLIPGLGEAGLIEKAGAGAGEAVGLGAEAASLRAAEDATSTARGLGLTGADVSKAAQQASEAALAPYSAAQKIGSKAVKYGVENMLVSSGDEVSKYLSDDPQQAEQGVGLAMANVGLSGLLGAGIGGGIGAISPLWKVAQSGRVGGVLGAIRDKLGGLDGGAPQPLTQALSDSGMEVTPEIRAGLSEVPEIQKIVKDLEQSDSTGSGQAFQKSMQDFRSQSADTLVGALGKTPEDINALADLSKAEAGDGIKDMLIKGIKDRYAPIADDYDLTSNRFAGVPLAPEVKASIAEDLTQLAQKEGWIKSPSSPEYGLFQTALKELPLQSTLDDLTKYQARIGSMAENGSGYNQSLSRAGALIKGVLRDAHADELENAVGAESPDLLEKLKLNNQAYKAHMNSIDALNDSLKVGKYSGTTSFIKALEEQTPETFLNRIGNEKNAGLLDTLIKDHPETALALRDYKINNLLREASFRAPEGQSIKPESLLKMLNEKMSPEYRKFLISEEAQPKVDAVGALLSHFNSQPHNFSNSARLLDRMWSGLPGSALAMASMVAGHNPAIGFLVGGMTKLLGRDAPDALKLGLLKFLGSSEHVDGEGFKSAVDFISNTIKGQTQTSNAVRNLFKAGAQVVPESLSDRAIEKLDEKLKELHTNPMPLFNTAGKTAHYMPSHGMMLSQTAASSVNYLNSLRPQNQKAAPLDEDMPVDKSAQYKFKNALRIAEDPLIVLNNVKDGSITADDVDHLKTLYPGLHQAISQKMLSSIVDAQTNDKPIPYHVKMGLSLFMGEPLDSTMTPQGIMAAQPKPSAAPSQQQKGAGPHSLKELPKLAQMYQTPDQAAEANKKQA